MEALKNEKFTILKQGYRRTAVVVSNANVDLQRFPHNTQHPFKKVLCNRPAGPVFETRQFGHFESVH